MLFVRTDRKNYVKYTLSVLFCACVIILKRRNWLECSRYQGLLARVLLPVLWPPDCSQPCSPAANQQVHANSQFGLYRTIYCYPLQDNLAAHALHPISRCMLIESLDCTEQYAFTCWKATRLLPTLQPISRCMVIESLGYSEQCAVTCCKATRLLTAIQTTSRWILIESLQYTVICWKATRLLPAPQPTSRCMLIESLGCTEQYAVTCFKPNRLLTARQPTSRCMLIESLGCTGQYTLTLTTAKGYSQPCSQPVGAPYWRVWAVQSNMLLPVVRQLGWSTPCSQPAGAC